MSSPNTCRQCGRTIPADNPGGFCAQCLLSLGLMEVESPESGLQNEEGAEGSDAAESTTNDAEGAPGEKRLSQREDQGHGEACSCRVRAGNEEQSARTESTRHLVAYTSKRVSGEDQAYGETYPYRVITEKPGDQIGRYRLLQEIGQGGCGMVYMAEQEEPVRRRVALKVIKLGMDTRQVVARFAAERQALALMDHPNIARVLDAGATHTGRPFFVMELVGGIKITDYCDQHRLTTPQRLQLFIQVCQAIQHAHQKGVIHRDIKPSNVLVSTQDGRPVPKVIDFGIAKATQGRLTSETVFTAFDQFLGTPAYMSPEQTELGGLDVDTRSDIYSLGVLLYELLTGTAPYDTRQMAAGDLEAMRRTIREQEPSRPSTRLSTMNQAQLKVAAERRRADAPRLIHLLRGDLDWIVMKCLEKDRARRYETANGLARDIERHLNQEPVLARPPSTLYRLHKFVRRNRVTTAAATAIVTVLVLGIAVSTWQAAIARRALWSSYLSEARALRLSGRAGKHFESLSVLHKAAAIRSSIAPRNEAIAAMVLPDIRLVGSKEFFRTRQSLSLDPAFENYALREPSGAVSIRRVVDDSEVGRLPDVGEPAIAVWVFSPDGRFLHVGYGGDHWRVWDWAKPAIAAKGESFSDIGFTPDSRILGVSDTTNLVLYQLANGNQHTLPLQGLKLPAAPGWFRFEPSGQRLAIHAAGEASNVFILNAQTGAKLQTLQHSGYVWAVEWHPSGKQLATGCEDKTIQIWDPNTGKRLRSWRTESCISLHFNQQGNLLASSGWDGYTRLWNSERGDELVSIQEDGHIVAFSPDARRLATAGWNGMHLDFLEVESGQGLQMLYQAPEFVASGGGWPAMDRAGRLLAFATQEGIGLWHVDTARLVGRLALHLPMGVIGFDAEGQNLLVTGREGLFRCPISKSASGEVRALGQPILVNAECSDPASGRAGWTSPDGKICAIVGNNRCQIFRTDTFAKLPETGLQRGMRFGDISPDGSLFASGAWHHGGVRVWDIRTGALIKELLSDEEEKDGATTVAFSPNGRHLVTATAQDYLFWEIGSWSLARRIQEQPSQDFVPMIAFSRDGRILAGTYAMNKVRLHDAVTGEVLADLEAPNSRTITGLAFNHDGTQLAVAESQDALRLWDLRQIRRQLSKLGLDWSQPPYPAEDPAPAAHADGIAARAPTFSGTVLSEE